MNHLTQMQVWGESSGIVVLDILNKEGRAVEEAVGIRGLEFRQRSELEDKSGSYEHTHMEFK